MSEKHVKEFVDRLDEDTELREKVRLASLGLFQVAKEHGYEFSHADLNKYLANKWGTTKVTHEEGDADTFTSIGSERPSF